MSKVRIYFGPKSGFTKYLIDENINSEELKSFPQLIREQDESKRVFIVKDPNNQVNTKQERIHVETIVIHSEEYASVLEHVITNFLGVMSIYTFENLYLHNPPDILKKAMKQAFPDYKEEYYEYEHISKQIIMDLNYEFDNRIIGQSEVKTKILSAFIPLLRENHLDPIVLLFWGPSGVGKTETAKLLAEKHKGHLFRKQLSMFQNNDFVTYLFGGHHNETSFAKELLDRETNVILLDEFDKTPSVFHSAFYQLFDEGIYEDKNYHVQVKKSIFICTSNYNSLEEIKQHLGEPIFSRFNACIQFLPLKKEDKDKIIKKRLDEEYNSLSTEEKEIISKENVLSVFLRISDQLVNARDIQTLIREFISRRILEKYISDYEQDV